MRKGLLIMMCLMLVGCQSSKEKSETAQTSQQKENLILKDWKYLSQNGDANEKGYYFIKTGEESAHLAYYDYETEQEVYLCNKPECQHKDKTCTAYLDDDAASELFVYQEHLYLIETMGSIMNTLGENQASGSKLVQMDLDGQNRKDIYQLNNDYAFESGSFIVGDGYLYIPVTKNKSFEIAKNSFMQATVEKYLCKIDLANGEGQQIMDMKYKDIIGVDGRTIIMNVSQYDEDPDKYLKENHYEKYDQIMLKGKINYEIYDLDSKETKSITAKQKNIGEYYQKKIYYINHSILYALDLHTEKEEKILDLKFEGNISTIINDYVIVEQWKNDEFYKLYKISLKEPKLEELKQYLRTPKEPVQILAQTSNQLLVMYDREGQKEKTWAGTMQYETKKEYIGLISIEDYLKNQRTYQQIKTLTEKRLY